MSLLAQVQSIGDTARTINARTSLIDYSRLTFQGEFVTNWHHELVARELDKVATGETKRLIIEQQSQTGKSELCSRRFPAYYAGRHPDHKIQAASYGSVLALEHAQEVRRTMMGAKHRAAFPGTRIKQRALSEDEVAKNTAAHFDFLGHRGSYRANGILGGLTGFGADLFIVDDPIKNREQADSVAYMRKLCSEFDSSIMTRLAEHAALVLIMTRWTDLDLVGYVLEQARRAGELHLWRRVNLPALMDLDPEQRHPEDPREMGEAMWEAKYSASYLRRRKLALTDRDWSSLYQQRPSRLGGGMFPATWWRRWRKDTLPAMSRQFISIDAGFKKSGRSWTVIQVWGVAIPNLYLLDQWREHVSYSETRELFHAVCEQYPDADVQLIEEAANGIALISDLAEDFPGIVPVPATESKAVRASIGQPLVRAGNVWIPHESIADWTAGPEGFVEEHRLFTGLSASGVFDDQVDAAAHAIGYFRREYTGGDSNEWWT